MKILVRATNWVGDAVLSLPALRAIRRRWSEAEIAILARAWVADLYQGQDCADRLLVADPAGRHRGFSRQERLARELRQERFDAAVLLPNSFASAWVVWRAGIPERIGYARDGRSLLLTRPVPVPNRSELPAHEAYYYLELLRRAGWIERLPAVEPIELRVHASAAEHAEDILVRAGVRRGSFRVALAPGAAYGSAKCWPPARYAALADRLIAECEADVILFGAAAENDVARRILGAMRQRTVCLVGRTSISELPALLARCHLFIGNDSGAMHVAAAVGLPVVGIFGPSDPSGTAPMTPRFTLVRQPVSCSPCFLRRCPVDHRCMTRIEVEDVHAVARSWVARSARSVE